MALDLLPCQFAIQTIVFLKNYQIAIPGRMVCPLGPPAPSMMEVVAQSRSKGSNMGHLKGMVQTVQLELVHKITAPTFHNEKVVLMGER